MKRFLILYLPLVLLIGGLTAFLGVKLTSAELTRFESAEATQLRASVRLVTQDLERPLEQLRGLAQEPALQRALSSTPKAATDSMQDALPSLLYRNPRYAQARWIGPDGLERVRVDRTGDGPVIVPSSELQDKSDRPYFTDTIRLQPGQAYLSALDLNVEHGKVEVPYRPMVRLAIRLPLVQGQDQGLLVINILAQHLLDETVASAPIGQGEQLMLLNAQGNWLLAPDPQDAWGHLLGRDNALAKRQPQAWARIAAAPEGRVRDNSGLWVWDSIDPATLWPGRVQAAESWKLVSHLSPDQLSQLRWQQWWPLLLNGGVILLLLAFGVQRYRRLLTSREVAEAELVAGRVLQQSQAQLNLALQAGQLGTFHHDLLTNQVTCSDQFAAIYGLPVGAPFDFEMAMAAIHPDDRQMVKDAVAQAIAARGGYHHDHRIIRPDGSQRCVNATVRVSLSPSGQALSLDGVIIDITERKRSEQLLRDLNENLERKVAERTDELMLLAQNASDVVYRASSAGVLEWLSPSVTGMVGWLAEDLLGKPFSAFVHPDDLATLESAQQRLRLGERTTFECRICERDGDYFWISVSGRSITDAQGVIQGCVGGWRDIHDEVESRQALQRSQDQLAKALAEMTASESRFHIMFDQSPLGMALIDSHTGQLYEVNTRFADMVGRTRTELQRIDWMAITHPDDRQADLDNMARLNAGEIAGFQMNKRYLKPDGSQVWTSMTIAPIQVATGESPRHLCMVDDITQRILAEQELAQYSEHLRQAQQIAHLGSWSWDIATNVNVWSDEHYRNLGYLPGSVSPDYDRFFERIAPADRDKVKAAIAATLESGAPYKVECHIALRDDIQRVVLFQGQLERDAQQRPLRMTGTSQDITEQNQIERDLRVAKELAEQASRAKSAFVANMSHEVRTPMNAVLGFLDILDDSGLDAQQHVLVEKVQKSSRALLRILNDILDFSKLDAGAVDLEMAPFGLDDSLRDATALFTLAASTKGLELVLDVPPGLPLRYRGDALRLGQILNNLLGNAIKFTEHGSVRIAVRALSREGDPWRLRFEVTDSGIGLTPEQMQRLFQPFMQADSSTTWRFGGTGLGLTIAKRLVELMGGEMGVQSEPGCGSTFWFTVQLAPDAQAERTQPARLKSERVLLVDDLDSVRQILGDTMRDWGFSVDAVADAATALQRLRQARQAGAPYSLLVLDWHMPGHDGLWLLRQLHDATTAGQLPHTPALLMVTAYERLALVRAAAASPAQPEAVLTKPIFASRLFDAVLKVQQGEQGGLARPEAAEAGVSDRYRRAEPIRGAELLLVEDNATNQEVALAMLGKMGLQVTVANNGREALQRLAEKDYDLVLMDLQMPVMDGFEATAAIRATVWGRTLPIIALTAAAFADDRRRVLDAGMNDFVSKPIDPKQLLSVLLRWLPDRQLTADVPDDTVPAPAPAAETPELAAAAVSLPAQLDGFELAQTLTRLDHDQTLLLRVLRQFLHDFKPDDWAGQFDAARAERQPATAQRLAHTLKGAAANVGAVRLEAAAQALELALQAGEGADPARLQACLDDCLAALRSANQVLQAGLPATVRPGTAARPEAALQDLAEVEALLRRHRLVPAALLARLRGHVGQHAVASQLEALLEQIGVFDFETALTTLKNLQERLTS